MSNFITNLLFEIEEREEYVDKYVFAGEEVFDVNLMDMYIDLAPC